MPNLAGNVKHHAQRWAICRSHQHNAERVGHSSSSINRSLHRKPMCRGIRSSTSKKVDGFRRRTISRRSVRHWRWPASSSLRKTAKGQACGCGSNIRWRNDMALNVRVYIREGRQLIDDGEDYNSDLFGGNIPCIGDTIMYFNKGGSSYRYKVVERSFEIGFRDPSYIMIVLEKVPLGEYAEMVRYHAN